MNERHACCGTGSGPRNSSLQPGLTSRVPGHHGAAPVGLDACSAGLRHYARLFGPRAAASGAFDRSLLPTPHAYLLEQQMLLRRARGSWTLVRCPVHKNGKEAKPSLVVSLIDGHFKCQACGVKGRDILALHQLLTGFGFIDAARSLGAWREVAR